MNSTPSPIIPELPKAADMLERVRAEAAELRSFTITFLSLLLYVAIIISSTTHEQILRIAPVKLPLLGVDIPIVGFYWFMPGFLFFLHLYILLQHYLFSQLAFRFRAALKRETDEETRNHLRRSLGNLPFLHWLAGRHNGFINFLMTAITVVSLIIWPVWTFWWLQAAFLPYHDNTIVWTQRAFLLLDAALLAYLWAKILDDKDDAGRWWKPWLAPFFYGLAKPVQAAVRRAIRWLNRPSRLAAWVRRLCPDRIIDRLRPRFGNGADTSTAPLNPITLTAVFYRWLLAAFLLLMLFLSVMVSTIPDSREEQWLLAWIPDSWITASEDRNNRRLFDWTARLHEQRRIAMDDSERNDYDPGRIHECRENNASDKQAQAAGAQPAKPESAQKCYWIDSPFPRNLILREKLLIANQGLAAEVRGGLSAAADASKADDLAKAEGLSLQGRHLEYADFSQSSMPNADLSRARLKAANLSGTKLEKAHLERAQLPGADLSFAQLTGAHLQGAQLPGADLSWAQLPGANLSEAQLPGADLSEAQLPGADLSWAQLPGANLSWAQLSGADLTFAQLPGANLSKAQLPGANLSVAQLTGANLSVAQLTGANLFEAKLPGADLSWSQLPGANLSEAQLSGANLSRAQLPGAILKNINFAPMETKTANAEVDKLYSALKNLPQYLGDSGVAALMEKINQFRQEITRSMDYSNLGGSEGCLTDEPTLKYLPPCKKMGDPEAQKIAYGIWVRLACEDDSEKHWLARRMIGRAEDSRRFPGFAPLLAAKLQTPDECPGLASLDDKLKKILLNAAKKTP